MTRTVTGENGKVRNPENVKLIAEGEMEGSTRTLIFSSYLVNTQEVLCKGNEN